MTSHKSLCLWFADYCDVFISYSQMRALKDHSPNSFRDAMKLYDYLVEIEGLKPWIDKNKPTLGDTLSKDAFVALKQCKAIIPIITRGYARAIQCVRELYYFVLLHPNQQCYAMMSEVDHIHREQAGKWLMKQIIGPKCLQQGASEQMISDTLRQKVCSQ